MARSFIPLEVGYGNVYKSETKPEFWYLSSRLSRTHLGNKAVTVHPVSCVLRVPRKRE